MRPVALAVALALVAAGPLARADESPPATSGGPADKRANLVARLGAVGAYRGLYNLSLYGGGVAFALGGELPHLAVLLNARLVDMRSQAGLVALEGSTTASLEARLSPGWRLGGGLGLTYLRVNRVTSSGVLESLGSVIFARVGYDFGEKPNVFVVLDLEARALSTGAHPWGPTVQVGLRF